MQKLELDASKWREHVAFFIGRGYLTQQIFLFSSIYEHNTFIIHLQLKDV